MTCDPSENPNLSILVPSTDEILRYFEQSCSDLGYSRTKLGKESVGYPELHKRLLDGHDVRLSTVRNLISFVVAQRQVSKHISSLAS